MSEGPKLYAHKPKKAQAKKFQGQHGIPSSSSSPAASSYTVGPQSAPPPPPPPPKQSFARRFKFLWPLLLTVNLAVGAYIYVRFKKKDSSPEEEDASGSTPAATDTTASQVTEKPLASPPILGPVKLREPIPENQQRELFKWMLEEKRKMRPRDPEEKKRVDEEKAILKVFIRAKSVPPL